MTDDNSTNDSIDTVTVPRFTITPTATQADRLTDNVRDKIGPARYYQLDENGEPTEDWWNVFERVAENVAVADATAVNEYDVRVSKDSLAEWVGQAKIDEIFGDNDTVSLTEDNASYFSFDGILDDIPNPVAENVQESAQKFKTLMKERWWIPNSPTMMNAGTELQQLSACFVDNPGDSMTETTSDGRPSISEVQSDVTDIFRSGGGVGYAFHHIRPKGSRVSTTGGIASGPLSFMQIYDATCGTVKQGGCVATSERIMTSEGYVPLGEVYDGRPLGVEPSDKRVYSRGNGLDSVIESSDSGKLPSVEISTESGYTLTVTENHPVLVLKDGELQFTPAEDLNGDEYVVLSAADKRTSGRVQLDELNDTSHFNSNVPTDLPDTMTDDLAKFLGVLWGDGCVSYDTTGKTGDRVVFTLGNDGNGDSSAQEFIESFCSEHGISLTTRDKSDTDKGNYTRFEIASSPFVQWLEQNALVKDSDDLASIPEAIYRSPNSIPSFLGGLTVDGHINDDASTVVYSTADENFAAVIQDLLLAIGIPSNVRKIGPRDDRFSENPIYTVSVFPGKDADQYDTIVPHFLDGNMGTTSGERQNPVDSPEFISQVLSDHFEKGHKLPDSVDRASMKELRRYERGKRTPSLDRVRGCFEDVGIDPDEYEVLDEENLFEQIDSITDAGPTYVCDIENKSGFPEYVASNFVVHNKRRGAQMGIMHCQHPDIGRFAVAKRDEDNFANFNISIGVTDEFIDAVENEENYTLYDPEDGWVDPEAFDAVKHSKHFYDPQYEDAWNEMLDKAGDDENGEQVEANFWRDYLDEMQDPEAFEEYRDQIDIEVGEPLEIPAGFIWQMAIDGAHNNGEPGLFNISETNREHSFDVEADPDRFIHATNPCAEQPLQSYEACNLGHTNLSQLVSEDAPMYDEYVVDNLPDFEDFSTESMVRDYMDEAFDMDRFEHVVKAGTHFLDNVVTMSKFPLDEIEDTVSRMRKIGMGMMGFHPMLIQMGIEYGSEESYAAGRYTMELIDEIATEKSHELAKERGTFSDWSESKWSSPSEYPEWFEKHAHEDPEEWAVTGYPVRNHNLTTIAPTGTTSMILDTTAGIEPIYNVAFYKNVADDIQGSEMLVEFDDLFLRTLEENDVDVDAVKEEAEELMEANEFDTPQDLETVPDEISDLFVTTQQLSAEQHIKIQSAFQEFCDSGISKTVNMANEATVDDISEAYKLIASEGIKGATIYRDGSRMEQVKTTRVDNELDTDALDDGELLDEVFDRFGDDDDSQMKINRNQVNNAVTDGGEE